MYVLSISCRILLLFIKSQQSPFSPLIFCVNLFKFDKFPLTPWKNEVTYF